MAKELAPQAKVPNAGTAIHRDGLRHWKTWCPSLYRDLKADGSLNKAAQDASKNAARQVAELMRSGARQDEAEEIVLRELILLPPEKEV